jgi:hypothetical protein
MLGSGKCGMGAVTTGEFQKRPAVEYGWLNDGVGDGN